MFRLRYNILFALLLLLPIVRADRKSDSKPEESENEDNSDSHNEDSDDEEDEDDNEEDEAHEKFGHHIARSTAVHKSLLTRTIKRRPLECYVCTYKSGVELKSCLDPWKNRVHTMTCPNLDDKCYTWIITSGTTYDTVMRGCRTGCIGSADTICCEFNRCNNQAFTLPQETHRLAQASSPSGDTKLLPPSVVFFVTILLILQTVARVASV